MRRTTRLFRSHRNRLTKAHQRRFRTLMAEPLEDRRMLSGLDYPELPGLTLVDPRPNQFEGQIVYLDFDGAEGVTYNGPVTVEDIDIPPFEAPSDLEGREDEIIAEVVKQLKETFAGTGLVFLTQRPSSEQTYSVVHVGGDNTPFAAYGSPDGLAEQIDVGNSDRNDKAFVFPGSARPASLSWIVQATMHELGHLLGYAHAVGIVGHSDNEIADVALFPNGFFGALTESVDSYLTGGLESAYQEGIKYLGYVSVGIPVVETFVDISATIYVDLADYYSSVHKQDAITQEGADDWVSVWVDVSVGLGVHLGLIEKIGFSTGVIPLAFDTDADPERQFSFEGLTFEHPLFKASVFTYTTDAGWSTEVVPRLSSNLGGDVVACGANVLRFEIQRSALDAATPLSPVATPAILRGMVTELLDTDSVWQSFLKPNNSVRAFTESDNGPIQHSGELTTTKIGLDVNHDGERDGFFMPYPDIYPAEVIFQNTGSEIDDFFVRVSSVPTGWEVYAMDDDWWYPFPDRKIDIEDVPGHSGEPVEPESWQGISTFWGIAAPEDGAESGKIVFELWHDGYALGNSLLDTVELDVRRYTSAPIPFDDRLEVLQGESITFNLSTLLENDVDPNLDTMWISGFGTPSIGILTNNGNGTATFTPQSGYSGLASFTYSITDGRDGSRTGYVVVDINRSWQLAVNSGAHGSIVDANGKKIEAVRVAEGEDFTVYADPDNGYEVSDWYVDGVVQSGSHGQSSFTVTDITSSLTLTATFRLEGLKDLVIERPGNSPYETGERSLMFSGFAPKGTHHISWENAGNGHHDVCDVDANNAWSDRLYLEVGANPITFRAWADPGEQALLGQGDFLANRKDNIRMVKVAESQSAFVSSHRQKKTYSRDIQVGYDRSDELPQYELQKMRGFIEFELPDLPVGSRITQAALKGLTERPTDFNPGAPFNITAYRSLIDWREDTVTWNGIFNLGDPTHTDAGHDTQFVVGANSDVIWDATGIVNAWYTGEANYGFILIAEDIVEATHEQRFRDFKSEDWFLEITYEYETDPPLIEIHRPTEEGSYATSESLLDIAGIASDSAKLDSVVWSNDSTSTSGSCELLSGNWQAQIPLSDGENRLVVTAIDDSGNSSLDTIIVDYITPPRDVTASDNLDGLIALSWSGATVAQPVYHVYRASSEDGEKVRLDAAGIADTTFFDDTGVMGQQYYYWVTATDLEWGVESDFSASAVGKLGEPEVRVAPESIDFGRHNIGQLGRRQVTIHNDGEVDLIIEEVYTLESPFIVFPSNEGNNVDDDWVIPPNESFEFVVQFTPDDGEVFDDEVTLLSNDPDCPEKVVTTSGVGNARPVAVIDSISTNPAQPPSDNITMKGSAHDTDGTVDSWEWRSGLDGLLSVEPEFSVSADDLSVGVHVISLRVTDNEGSISEWQTETLTILNARPMGRLQLPTADVVPGSQVPITLEGHDNDERGQSVTSWEIELAGESFQGTELGQFVILAPQKPGVHEVRFRVQDEDDAGEHSWSSWAVATLTVRDMQPTAALDNVPPDSVVPETLMTITLAGQDWDENGQSIVSGQLLLDDQEIATPLPGSFLFNAPDSPGTHVLKYRVWDNESSVSDWAIASFEVGNALPTANISGVPTRVVKPESSFSIVVHGWDGDEQGEAIVKGVLRLNDVEIGRPMPGDSFLVTAPALLGQHTLSYQVRDDEDAWSELVLKNFTVANAAVRISETDEATLVAESGAHDTYFVVLESQPTADVFIDLTPDNQIDIHPTQLHFTPQDWDSPKTVFVAAVDDDRDEESPHHGTIAHSASSADRLYDGIDIEDVKVIIADNDTAGVTINPTAGLVTTEPGGNATFTVVLDSEPIQPVTIELSSNLVIEGTVSPASLTFEPSEWNSLKTATVTGVDDALDDGDMEYVVTTNVVSGDPKYNGYDADDVAVTNQDDDEQGLVVVPLNVVVNEGGVAQFTISLAAQPIADVDVEITAGPGGDPDLSVDLTDLVFSPANWEQAQNVTISAAEDVDSSNGSASYVVSSTGLPGRMVVVIERDNDSPDIPFLVGPLDGAVIDSRSVTLEFEPLKDYDGDYLIRLHDEHWDGRQASGFQHDSNQHYLSIRTKSTSVTVPVERGESYRWWVHKPGFPAAGAGFSVKEGDSQSSDIPTLISPIDDVEVDGPNVTLKFEPLDGYTGEYLVRLEDLHWDGHQADGFAHDSNQHYLSIRTASTSIRVPVEAGETYRWWVHKPGFSAAGAGFSVKEDDSQSSDIPKLVTPTDGQVIEGSTVTLEFEPVPGYTGNYLVRMEDMNWDGRQASGFSHDSRQHYLSISTASTRITVPVEQGEQYRWWVHKPGFPAAGAGFSVAEAQHIPTLLGPLDGAKIDGPNVTLEFEPLPGYDGDYLVRLHDKNWDGQQATGFQHDSKLHYLSIRTRSTRITLPVELGEDYAWWVHKPGFPAAGASFHVKP